MNSPKWSVFGMKLHFLANKSQNTIKPLDIKIIWENFWVQNFGPMGPPWGTWGHYLRRGIVEYFVGGFLQLVLHVRRALKRNLDGYTSYWRDISSTCCDLPLPLFGVKVFKVWSAVAWLAAAAATRFTAATVSRSRTGRRWWLLNPRNDRWW